jgi:hypothetical protein
MMGLLSLSQYLEPSKTQVVISGSIRLGMSHTLQETRGLLRKLVRFESLQRPLPIINPLQKARQQHGGLGFSERGTELKLPFLAVVPAWWARNQGGPINAAVRWKM